jgi:hypothetical protein
MAQVPATMDFLKQKLFLMAGFDSERINALKGY